MKIAYLVTDLGPGGTQYWVELASRALTARGHNVLVVGDQGPHDRRASIQNTGATVMAFESAGTLTEYTEVLRREDPDLLHLHVWRRTEELSSLGKSVGVPLVRSYHHVPQSFGRIWAGRIAKPWRLVSLVRRHLTSTRSVDMHVGCCLAAAHGVRGELWPFWQRRVACVRNAVPPQSPTLRDVLAGPPRFLQVGSLVPRKNPDATLRAFAELKATLADATLTYVGDGGMRPHLQHMVRDLRVGDVTFAGQVNDPREFYGQSNVAILPSRREGLPFSLLEAASAGLPLIATDIDGHPEVVAHGQNGFLVPAGDSGALADAMRRLGGDPELRIRMGQCSRLRSAERFDFEGEMDVLLGIYARLVRMHQRGSGRVP